MLLITIMYAKYAKVIAFRSHLNESYSHDIYRNHVSRNTTRVYARVVNAVCSYNIIGIVNQIKLVAESQQLVIKRINVPSAVKVGDVDHVILDCDYDLENTSSKGLVVKWFFDDERVVYQWIYTMTPVANELIAKHVDLTYKASNDPLTEYRAMKLNEPGIALTGDYTCVISTYQDERVANASMVIYCECV